MRLFSLLLLLLSTNSRAASAPHVDVEWLDFGNGRGGLHFRLEKHWHVYWKNPGDSGEPVKVDAGRMTPKLRWPFPAAIRVGPLVNYGYEDEVLLPLDGRPTGPLNVSWLVCQEECIPGKARLSPVRASDDSLYRRWTARVPERAEATARAGGDDILLTARSVRDVRFFPANPGQIDNAAPQALTREGDRVTLRLKRAENAGEIRRLDGTLIGRDFAFDVEAPFTAGAADAGLVARMLIFAFLGGAILNLMPCVFPILSVKALGLLKVAGRREAARAEGALYTLGVLVSFWALAGVLLFLRAGGERLGWGYQLQSTGFLFVLGGLLFLMALSLLGAFEVGGGFAGWGGDLVARDGHVGSFFGGVLATLVATPCTAPFMGTALGFAVSQPALVALAIFTSLGLGMAAPYLLLCLSPFLGRYLPRPGRWMESLKGFMAFPLLGTVVWLVWVMGQRGDVGPPIGALAGYLVLGVGAWVWGKWRTREGVALGFLCVVGGVALGFLLPNLLARITIN